MEQKIKFEDFQKVKLTVGKILSAEKIPETDKSVRLSVDLGEKNHVRLFPASPSIFLNSQNWSARDFFLSPTLIAYFFFSFNFLVLTLSHV